MAPDQSHTHLQYTQPNRTMVQGSVCRQPKNPQICLLSGVNAEAQCHGFQAKSQLTKDFPHSLTTYEKSIVAKFFFAGLIPPDVDQLLFSRKKTNERFLGGFYMASCSPGGEASASPFLRACIPTTICVSGIFRGLGRLLLTIRVQF